MAQPRRKTFMIVDGHALLHRAWHALPPLTTKSGMLVHGAYGFTVILLGALREINPDYVAVTFDLRAPTFRHERYAEYKATREKKPDELYAQKDVVEEILEAMRISVFALEGYEADDVIGTLATRAKQENGDLDVVIVTGDMDTLQLVDARTRIFTLRRGMTDTVIYDVEAVRERYGLRPGQMIDYKALRGDPSDNIPGVRGIGEKTATELLAAFGSIDELYRVLDAGGTDTEKVKPSAKKALLEHRADAMLARELVTIDTTAPIEFSLERCRFIPVSKEKVAPVFEKLQFTKLLSRFPDGQQTLLPVQAAVSAPTIPLATDPAKGLMVLENAKRIAVRSISASEHPLHPDVHFLGLSDGKTTVLLSVEEYPAHRDALARIFAGKSEKVCHDFKHEMHALRSLGFSLDGAAFDLMIASYLLFAGERRHSLEAMLGYYRNLAIDSELEPRERLAAEISQMLSVADELRSDLEKNGLTDVHGKIEIPTSKVLSRIEEDGIRVDVPYLESLSEEFGTELERLVAGIYKIAGGEFNINSPAQLKTVLFDRLNVPTVGIKKTAKGAGLSTAASELEKLRGAHPIIDLILGYREFSKLKSTYVGTLPSLVDKDTGRIHANFNQTVAATGRLSSSNPNLQNIPTSETENGRKVRNAFVAARGMTLLSADYSQIELRIAAHLAKEKAMIDAFKNGEDIHTRTAAEMFGEAEAKQKDKRRVAKVINFGILYGMGPQRLAETAGITFNEAREYIERYFAIYTGIAAYIEKTTAQLKELGYVETLFGRKRFFRNYAVLNKREQAEAERQAVNLPIQGTSADIIKLAMIAVQKRIDTDLAGKAKMVGQVHDELVFEVRKAAVSEVREVVVPLMADAAKLLVPIVVDSAVGTRWGDMKDLEA
jgi:DNA polymerase-1